jgi:hypothetical protein
VNQGDVRWDPWRQAGHHLRIQLDRDDVRHPRRQSERQRARTRSDLHEPLIRSRSDRLDELVSPRRFKKVLAVSLLRADAHLKSTISNQQSATD